MQIEVGDSKVPVTIGETTHELTLGECLQLINALRRVFPREMLIGEEIVAGKTQWSGPREGSPPPINSLDNAVSSWSPTTDVTVSSLFGKTIAAISKDDPQFDR